MSNGKNGAGGSSPGVTTTLIILAVVIGSVFLAWQDKINGDAYVALTSAIIGGVLVRSGVSSGSQAAANPPAED